jgi:hypothetical protein
LDQCLIDDIGDYPFIIYPRILDKESLANLNVKFKDRVLLKMSVYLWSQFSQTSQQYLEDAQRIPNMQIICIDHPSIRNQILKSNKVKVGTVPCILEASQGKLSQYEGIGVSQWFQYQKSKSSFNPRVINQPVDDKPLNNQQSDGLKFHISAGPMKTGPTQSFVEQPPPIQQREESPQNELKFNISAGPMKTDVKSETKETKELLPDVTPISQITGEPSLLPQQLYQPLIPQMNKTAEDHYQQFVGSTSNTSQPQNPGQKSLTPKEQMFQQILAQANKEQMEREQNN